MQLSGFAGQIALITGAGGGIGRAIVAALHRAGAVVVASDLAAPDFRDLPGVHSFALDVRDSAATAALVARVEAEIGPVQFGLAVAGVLQSGCVVETEDAAWRQVFAVNTDGVFHLTRALARVMQPRGRGVLLSVASNAAKVPRYGMAAYGASKAANMIYMRSLGLELAPHGIRCNILAPGSTRTEMQTGMWQGEASEAGVLAGYPAQFKPGIPLGRIAEPEDIADAAMFLLSDQARHITMADLVIDGGATQQV